MFSYRTIRVNEDLEKKLQVAREGHAWTMRVLTYLLAGWGTVLAVLVVLWILDTCFGL